MSLKGNQGTLYEDVAAHFTSSQSPEVATVTVDGGHGRIETRAIRATDDIAWLKARSVSDCRTQVRNVSGVLPIFGAIETIADH